MTKIPTPGEVASKARGGSCRICKLPVKTLSDGSKKSGADWLLDALALNDSGEAHVGMRAAAQVLREHFGFQGEKGQLYNHATECLKRKSWAKK